MLINKTYTIDCKIIISDKIKRFYITNIFFYERTNAFLHDMDLVYHCFCSALFDNRFKKNFHRECVYICRNKLLYICRNKLLWNTISWKCVQ